MAAPFEQAYEEHYKLKEEASKFSSEDAPQGIREGGTVKAIHYREEEAIYVKASHDRVTVIFSTIFREETDRVFGKVFIQEFVDARRRAIQNAPQVLFRNDPPLELQSVPGIRNTGSEKIGYVTFGMCTTLSSQHAEVMLTSTVLFPRHLTPQRMPEVISHIQTFRDYFHYHIKASKAYIHSRMRKRTADFLQGEMGRSPPLLYVMCLIDTSQCSAGLDPKMKNARGRQRAAGRSRCKGAESLCSLKARTIDILYIQYVEDAESLFVRLPWRSRFRFKALRGKTKANNCRRTNKFQTSR